MLGGCWQLLVAVETIGFVGLLVLPRNLAVVVASSYRPGISPRTYALGENIPLYVDALTSTKTQIPVGYYTLPFCQPAEGPKMRSQTLGEFIEGSQIMNSPLSVSMAAEAFCRKLCQVTYSEKQYEQMKWHILRQYHYNWLLDHLPAACFGSFWEQYANGFPIGIPGTSSGDVDFYIMNHFNIVIDYHRVEAEGQETGYRVVEFAVQPMSVKHKFEGNYTWDGIDPEGFAKPLATCQYREHLSVEYFRESQILMANEPILFTYDIIWRNSDKPWSKRWEIYLTNDNRVPMAVHWYSITNSLVVLVVLSTMMAAVWVRANKPLSELSSEPSSRPQTVRSLFRFIRKTIMATSNNNPNRAPYTSLSTTDNDLYLTESLPRAERVRQEELNWRRLRGDVFRPPQTLPDLFCALIGTGAQLFVACFGVVALAAMGFVSQAVSGTLPNFFLILFNLSGFVSGYVSYRLCASFGTGPTILKRCVTMGALIIPSCAFASFCFLNICLRARNSTASLPFLDVFTILLGWLLGMIPLCLLGAYAASLQQIFEYPTHTNPIPREIPLQTNCFKKPFVSIAISGILTFGALFVEINFGMSSLWRRQYYYVFGVAFLVYTIALMTVGMTCSLMVYFQLALENHRWQWFCMFCGGSVGAYVGWFSFVYSSDLDLDSSFVTFVVYFTYMFWISAAVFLIFGSVGTLSAFFFLIKLYSTLGPEHIDDEATLDGNDESGYIVLNSMAPSFDPSQGNRPDQTGDTSVEEHQRQPDLHESAAYSLSGEPNQFS